MYVHKTIGTFPKLITVPSHYFKVVLARRFTPVASSKDVTIENLSVAAFLVPNEESSATSAYNSNKGTHNTALSSYLVKLDQLESIVGFSFFEDYMLSVFRLEELELEDSDLFPYLVIKCLSYV